MALVLTLKQGQGFMLGPDKYVVGDIRSSHDFDLHTDGSLPVRVRSSQWTAILPGKAWVMASYTRRVGSKDVGLMIDAPSFNVVRCVD